MIVGVHNKLSFDIVDRRLRRMSAETDGLDSNV
jgi:hypothetical protein